MIDGSPAGPTKLVSLDDLPSTAGIQHAIVNGKIYVAATVDPYGREIWTGSAMVAPELPGDFDRDGVISGNDFLRWQRELGGAAPIHGAGADGDASGRVDGGDLMTWREQYPIDGEELAPVIAGDDKLPAEAAADAVIEVTTTPTASAPSLHAAAAVGLPQLWWTGDAVGAAGDDAHDEDPLLPPVAHGGNNAGANTDQTASPGVRDACFAAWTPFRPAATIDGYSTNDAQGVSDEWGALALDL
jgi:hypothetical protein